MTQYLPPNLLALFAPRDPIPYLQPVGKLPHEKKNGHKYHGVGNLLYIFEDPKDTPPPTRVETREERMERKRREKQEQMAYKLEQEIALWDPHGNSAATGDPFKSLFVARINYDSSESKLRREFEVYGPIKKIVMSHDMKTGKPRGYAFIEYEHERDMHSAYKHADGKKIDGRRVLVDVERARTVKGWLPRRLGGGLGGTRRGGPEVNIRHSGREDRDMDSRYRDRERERERENRPERRRSRSRERPERPERPEREERPERINRERRRRSRSRSRERKRRRSRSRERVNPEEGSEKEEKPPRKRSRSRERKRHRSRSRDRKRDRRERERDRERRERERGEGEEEPQLAKIKQEPVDDYPEYTGTLFQNNNPEMYGEYADVEVKYEKKDGIAEELGVHQQYNERGTNGEYNDGVEVEEGEDKDY